MNTGVLYVMLIGEDEEVAGYIRSEEPPTMDAMLDKLTLLSPYKNRSDFVNAHRGVRLGFVAVH